MSPPPVVAVVGPTATGKTALAVALAHRLGGEVVNADSMQLYRGMDIGTAKPDLAERDGVPHHLLDLWHVRETASVAEYRRLARAEIDRLRASGTVPLLVGGSGLYVRAVLDELEFPGTDAASRTCHRSSRWCGTPPRSTRSGFAVPMSMPRYSCMESALTTSPPRRWASATASAVLPVAVGPTTATTGGIVT